jgi:hypothetical protein
MAGKGKLLMQKAEDIFRIYTGIQHHHPIIILAIYLANSEHRGGSLLNISFEHLAEPERDLVDDASKQPKLSARPS